MKEMGAATLDAARRRGNLNICLTPQKLNDHESPMTRAIHFARQRFQLKEGGPRLRGRGTAASIAE
jgi:hypothetical protein